MLGVSHAVEVLVLCLLVVANPLRTSTLFPSRLNILVKPLRAPAQKHRPESSGVALID